MRLRAADSDDKGGSRRGALTVVWDLRKDATVTQTLRSTVASTLAYLVALWLSSEPAPLTAPLTALLVVQVTLYSTLTTSVRRVNAVVAGVLIAIGFSALVGLSWWSLALIILASLLAGRVVRADEFVPEVAISAMLVLGVTHAAAANTAWDRVLETLIGAVVGLLFNVFAPPVWIGAAGESIEGLARRMRRLMRDVGEELTSPTPVERAAARLHEARRLDQGISEVDAALRQAEDSLRLNPRVKEGLLHRVVLRTGLDTLEICAVVLRVITRTITDLAKERQEEDLFTPEEGAGLEELLSHIADALVSFAVLVTTQTSEAAEAAEDRLAGDLSAASGTRERVANLLLEGVQRHPRQWQLHGALLSEIDRLLDELDTDHRSQRLLEELDKSTREQREKHPQLTAFAAWLRGVRRPTVKRPSLGRRRGRDKS
ncbi:FUSC family protein [Streptomyces camponoticapitis]|uniref:FUSC family protein n=1 Tax=Streptomyces camponoticapitis TaxID=1616125 RepID=A0ABQ2EP32_9ACTN|nr:aromatic acid exporter family protein [Streptomyces camponoticapitis]GGK19553.1 FUSC family protein [Streptomyces camponoticapitis]